MSDQNQDNSTDVDDVPDAQDEQVFTADYVRQLRKEAKANRLKAAAAQRELDAVKEREAAAEATKLAEQGEFQKLAEQRAARIAELEPYQAKVEQITAAAKEANERFVSGLPDDKKTLVPLGYEPLRLQEWIAVNREFLIGSPHTVPPTNGGAGLSKRPSSGSKLSPAEKAMADKFGMTYDEYAANK